MPQKVTGSTCRKAEQPISLLKKTVLMLRWVFCSWERVRRLCVWLVIALVVTTGMGAAANRLARELSSVLPTGKLKKKPEPTKNWDSGSASWWEPGTTPADDGQPSPLDGPAKTKEIPAKTEPASVQGGSAGVSVDHGFQNSSGAGFKNQFAPIGSKFSSPSFPNSRERTELWCERIGGSCYSRQASIKRWQGIQSGRSCAYFLAARKHFE